MRAWLDSYFVLMTLGFTITSVTRKRAFKEENFGWRAKDEYDNMQISLFP